MKKYLTIFILCALAGIVVANAQSRGSKSTTNSGKQYVDLGLPSGTLWATMNVGANKPEDYGDYFAWGVTMQKQGNNWSTYKWSKGAYDNLTKYCDDRSYGVVDNKTELSASDDAAIVNWGPEWRTPTQTQFEELGTECTWKWTSKNGVEGYLVSSKRNSNSIFLPAAGCFSEGKLIDVGEEGGYWSRTLCGEPYNAYIMSFYSDDVDWTDYGLRVDCFTVRAVRVSR